MFCIVRDVIATDIILSQVMIKPDYAVMLENNDADQPTYLHSLTNAFAQVHAIIVAMSRNCQMSVQVVSKCCLLQHYVAHFCALGRIVGQTSIKIKRIAAPELDCVCY